MGTNDRRPGDAAAGRRRDPAGFTLLEMAVVPVIGGVLIAMSTLTFSNVNTRSSARRAAQVFARDLALARSMAVRGRERVVIRFDEGALWYDVDEGSGSGRVAGRRGRPDRETLHGFVAHELGTNVYTDRCSAHTTGSQPASR